MMVMDESADLIAFINLDLLLDRIGYSKRNHENLKDGTNYKSRNVCYIMQRLWVSKITLKNHVDTLRRL